MVWCEGVGSMQGLVLPGVQGVKRDREDPGGLSWVDFLEVSRSFFLTIPRVMLGVASPPFFSLTLLFCSKEGIWVRLGDLGMSGGKRCHLTLRKA